MIYLITSRENSICKIGYSANPEKRLATLQTGCAYKLRLEGVLEGTQKTEKLLHKKFQAQKLAGEWFTLKPEIIKCFEGYVPETPCLISNKLLSLLGKCSKPEIYLMSDIVMNQRSNKSFRLTKKYRQVVAGKSHYNIRTIDNAIASLTSAEFLIRLSPATYKISQQFVRFS